MLRLPIFPKLDINGINSLNQTPPSDLPLFYMSDWSLMGLVVSDCNRAANVLEDHFTVIRGLQGTEVLVDGFTGVAQIIDALNGAGIDYSLSDVVRQVYQG